MLKIKAVLIKIVSLVSLILLLTACARPPNSLNYIPRYTHQPKNSPVAETIGVILEAAVCYTMVIAGIVVLVSG